MIPVSKTAFMAARARVYDAASRKPLCGDYLASRYNDRIAHDIYNMLGETHDFSTGIAIRHGIIDEIVISEIEKDSNVSFVLVGAGLDTRAFRINGGEWFELDHESIITYKSSFFPDKEALNPLSRIEVDFSSGSLERGLRSINFKNKVIFIFEGVFMYLTSDEISRTLSIIRSVAPNHVLVCDIMRKECMSKYFDSLGKTLERLGATVKLEESNQEEIVTCYGYRLEKRTSIVSRRFDLGYSVYKFQTASV